MQTFVGHIPPAVNFSEHRARSQTGQAGPRIKGRDWAQSGQGRAFENAALQLPVAFAAAQVAGHALARRDFGVLHAQVDQFVGAKAAPEPQQHQAAVAGVTQQGRPVAGLLRVADGGIEPLINLLEHR